MMKAVELVFIPSPNVGHLVSMAELAKHLLDRDERLSITLLLMASPFDSAIDSYTQSLIASDTRIRYIHLPRIQPPSSDYLLKSPENFLSIYLENHKPNVKTAITNHVSSNSVPLAGLVVDFFCTSMIDVANEFGVPSYLFFTSSAAFLGFMLFLPTRHIQIGTEFNSSDSESIVPSYANPVPASVLPSPVLNKEGGYTCLVNHATRFKETKGMIVNTFAELEPHAVNSIGPPKFYAIGPLIDLKGQNHSGSDPDEILKWLDNQPPSSVVFLCFGSMGSFGSAQLGQMATALEQSGQRFLWSVRLAPPNGNFEIPKEYTKKIEDILPEGFLKRTEERGMVCGWAPQVEVLAHKAIGGFVSHCGWNSILESVWYGVPIVTWPMYAEQQINAFEMVKDLGLAVELKLDYRIHGGEVVMAAEIARAITSLMDDENPVRKRAKEMKEKSRKAVIAGGSSFDSLGRLIEDTLEQ